MHDCLVTTETAVVTDVVFGTLATINAVRVTRLTESVLVISVVRARPNAVDSIFEVLAFRTVVGVRTCARSVTFLVAVLAYSRLGLVNSVAEKQKRKPSKTNSYILLFFQLRKRILKNEHLKEN